MSLAYTTHFHSLDKTLWDISININGYEGKEREIRLEGDEPCVIEWQETDKMDVVQPSICTLRVSNETDRQMLMLMYNRRSSIIVKRNGVEYWRGIADDSVYEEPYSYKESYVTELTFSDFGILNRIPFTLTGKQSVKAIVDHCLEGSGLDYLNQELLISLLEPKTEQPITLSMLFINADRFATKGDSWGEMTMKRDVLEEILRPLGLRIVQKNGQIYIYDLDYLRDNFEMQNYVVWNGTDAIIKGSETFGWYEVVFEKDSFDILAEDGLEYDSGQWSDSNKFFAPGYDLETETDGDVGFCVEVRRYISSKLQCSSNAKFFRSKSVFTETNDIGVAWRIKCKEYIGDVTFMGHTYPVGIDRILLGNQPVCVNSDVENVFLVETGYLPFITDRDKFQLRINLDFLISFRPNPFDSPPDEWSATQDYHAMEESWETQASVNAYLVPVILELIDDNDNVVCHYENADFETHGGDIYNQYATDVVRPFGINNGRWEQGAGSYGQMYLAYYNTDNNEDPLIEKGWVTNRIASPLNSAINGTLYRVRKDGEYVSLPPHAGRLRLTVGNGIFVTEHAYYSVYSAMFYGPDHFQQALAWQLYRNPKIMMVKADRRDDEIDTDSIYERDMIGLYEDNLSKTVKVGSWRKGIAPSSRGLLFNTSGNAFEKFLKNGSLRTLEEHFLRTIEDQTYYTQPIIIGTAELTNEFCALKDHSTQGVFLIVAQRQDLQQGTEYVTMARIANVGGLVYEFHWGDAICAQDVERYTYEWADHICVQANNEIPIEEQEEQ